MRSLPKLAAAAALVAASAGLSAQPYPAQPVRLVVMVASGGPSDILARAVSPKLGETLGQQVIVDNRPGAGGTIATAHVAKAAPDGYTLLLADMSFSTNPSLYKGLTFNIRDFAPVGLVSLSQMVLLVNPSQPAKEMKQLIALARNQPGKLSYGHAPGTPTHLGPEALKEAYDLDILSVPYKGIAPALTDLMAGRITFVLVSVGGAKSFIQSGKLRPLAITGRKRAPVVPEVPTFAETGVPLPDMDYGSWWGIVAPAAVPKDRITTANAALNKALRTPEVAKRLASLSYDAEGGTPEQFGALIQSEATKWTRVIQRAGVKID
jgi:tripartite-type tricarboxylate transporter receptor subunit TctC